MARFSYIEPVRVKVDNFSFIFSSIWNISTIGKWRFEVIELNILLCLKSNQDQS